MTYENLSNLLKVIADPKRLEILDILSCGELYACDLLVHFDLSQPTLSHHLKVLHENDLIYFRREGNKKMYNLNKYALKEIDGYLELIPRDDEECVCKSISKDDCAS